jgi:hypothetical protein
MMKNFMTLILTVLLSLNSLISATPNLKPEKVYRYVYVQESEEWYVEQAKQWKKEIASNPKDINAWANYFMANKYSHWMGDLSTYKYKMDSILTEMGKKIPNSYEYNYFRFYNGERDVSLLEKAYKIDPQRADGLYELVMYYDTQGDEEKLKKFCKELYQTGDISPGLLDYNYNVLASTEKNGILFTNGDNDTYPAWVLQHALDIRKDVTILNLHLTFVNRDYLKKRLLAKGIDLDVESLSRNRMSLFMEQLTKQLFNKYPQIPVHVALTVYKNKIRNVEEDLYLVGLTFKYSRKRFDNILSIKRNVYNSLRLDYLEYDWYSEQYLVTSLLDKLHVNYVVVFLKLAEDLHESGKSEEAALWKKKALRLAEKANNEQFVNHINEIDW